MDFAQPDWMANLPALALTPGEQPPPKPNLFTSALSSGFHEALGNIGGTAQALGTATGLQGVTDWGAGLAKSQAEQAKAAGREDLEKDPLSFSGALYGLTKMLPSLAPMAVPFVGATARGIGLGASMLTGAVGGNVEEAQKARPAQPLSGEDAAKSLLLGVPEAAAMMVVPHLMRDTLAKGAAGDFIPRVAGGMAKLGLLQGVQSGVQTAVTQAAFTPDMSVSDRANQIITSALSGGIAGSVFGGLSHLRRAPVVTPETPTADIGAAVDSVVKPPEQLALPPPSGPRDLPLSGEPQAPHAATPTPDLVDLANTYANRGEAITPDEKIQQGFVNTEIARRTAPGLTPGEGTLFTPDQMMARAPAIEATKQLAIAAAGGEAGSPPVPIGSERPSLDQVKAPKIPAGAQDFIKSLTATNEPELVNSIALKAETYADKPEKAPDWFKQLAETYGVKIGDTGKSPAEMLVDYTDQERNLLAQRDAAMKTGSAAAIRTANRPLVDLAPKITEARRLIGLHMDAAAALEQARPAPLPEPEVDATGQANLPGMGTAVPGEAQTELGKAPYQDPNQPQLPLDVAPDAGRPQAVADFKNSLLEPMGKRDRAKIEPILAGMDVASQPELIAALKEQHAALNGGVPSPGLGALLAVHGIADKSGVPIDLIAVRKSIEDKYDELMGKVKSAKGDGQANIYFNKAMELRNTELKSVNDLIQQHHQADDLSRTAPPVEIPAPQGTPQELVKPWEVMEHVKEQSADDPKLALAAETAQEAVLRGDDRSREIMEPVLQKFAAKQRRSREKKPAAVPGAAGVEGFNAEMRRQDALRQAPAAPGASETPIIPASALSDRIKQAFSEVTDGKFDRAISLNKIRDKLQDVDRATLDKELLRMHLEDPQAKLIPEDNGKARTKAVKEGAVDLAGDPHHKLWVGEPEAVAAAPPVEPATVAPPPDKVPSMAVPAPLEAANEQAHWTKAAAAAAAAPVDPRTGFDPARETERMVNEMGPNIGADTDRANREGGDAYRTGEFGLNDNPYSKVKDPNAWESWREGWRTARRPKIVAPIEAEAPRKALPRRMQEVDARNKVAKLQASGNLTPAEQADFDRTAALANGGALDAWSKFENRLAISRELTGVRFEEPAPIEPEPMPEFRPSEPRGRGGAPTPPPKGAMTPAERLLAFRKAQAASRGEPDALDATIQPMAGADPNWAQRGADQLRGDVVYQDDRHALIRGFDDQGRSVYVPADRNLNLRGSTDVRNSKLSWLDKASQEKFVKQAEAAEAADQAKYNKNPDGPFKDASAKVVGSQNADPRIVSYIGNLMHMMGINARVLVTHPDDVRGTAGDALGLNGPYTSARTAGLTDDLAYMRPYGPSLNDFHIHIDPKLSDTMRMEAAAHEVGHIVYLTALQNSPPEVRAAIDAAYNQWYKSAARLNSQDLIQATRNRETSRTIIDKMSPNSYLTQRSRSYYLNKGEWFADNVSRWATTAEKPRGIVETFFHAVGQKIRQLITAVTGNKYLPDPVVSNFLNHLGSGSEQQWGSKLGSRIPTTTDTGARTFNEANAAVPMALRNIGEMAQGVSDTVERTRVAAPVRLRKAALGWETMEGIVRISGDLLKSSKQWMDTHIHRQIYTDAKDKADVISAQAYNHLKDTDKAKPKTLVDEHLAMLTISGIDSRKPLNDAVNRWILTDPNRAKLEIKHDMMVRHLDAVTRAGGRPALDGILQMMQTKGYQAVASMLHSIGENWAEKGIQFAGHGVNPDETYRGMTGVAGHDSPVATNVYYKNTAKAMLDGIEKHLIAEDAKARAATGNPRAIAGGYDGLRSQLEMAQDRMAQADKGTYSPLGRGDGNYFAATRLVTGADGKPTPAATQALADALDKAGFTNVGVIHDTASNTVMVRVEDQAKMHRLGNLFEQLGLDGHVEPGSTKIGYPESIDTFAGLGPAHMKAMIEAANSVIAKTTGLTPQVAEQLKKAFVARWMDMLPDQSTLKNLVERTYSSGFSEDMGKIAIKSALNQSRASTGVSMQGAFARASEAMRQEVESAKSGLTGHPVATNDVANELWTREAQQAWRIPNGVFDKIQTLMHTLKIGFNPPYILTMMSQIPTLLHPELAKKMGYANSAKAIFRATPRSLAILRAVMSSPDWYSVGFRETALQKAGISAKDIKTIMDLDNRGGLSNATYTTQMSDLGEGHAGKYHQMSNAMGVYAEMIPRVVGALAAGDAYDARPVKGMSREDYVHDIVNSSQFNWGAGQSSRMTGKKGPLGSASRIVFAFTSFQTKLIEKLYIETHAAVTAKWGSAEKKEATKFLAAHAVAMTALAGTLGLPLVGAFAGVADIFSKLLTGKDDIDTEGLYRTWLAHTFGPDVGDVISKGLPRALGIDLSRLGEGKLLPGTSILQDKRKFEDASKDWLRSLAGSATGEATDIWLAGRDVMNGDWLKGANRVLPEGAKGLGEALYFYKNGYIDKSGIKYPVQPSTWNIIVAALGLDPSNLAQYNEAGKIRAGLEEQRSYRARNITEHLTHAALDPNAVNMDYWQGQALDFMKDHPGLANPLQGMGHNLSIAFQRGVMSRALGTPLGVNPLDLGMRSATGFINPQQ